MNFEDLNNFPIEIVNNNLETGVFIESNTGMYRFCTLMNIINIYI